MKGALYEVLGIAIHSETDEQLVVYRRVGGDGRWWVRPEAMFAETVERDGRNVPRFTRIE